MGRVAAAADNAALESFFALLQKTVLNRRTCHTRDELPLAIVTWIERLTTGAAASARPASSPPSSSRQPSATTRSPRNYYALNNLSTRVWADPLELFMSS